METFRNDPLLSQVCLFLYIFKCGYLRYIDFFQMSQGVQIRYGGCPHAKEPERRQTFVRDCSNRLLPVVGFFQFFCFRRA